MTVAIWPVPQRFLDPSHREYREGLAPFTQGGCYLTLPGCDDVTGQVAHSVVVDVTEGARTRMTAATIGGGETPGVGRVVRVNLFPQRHGWRWLEGTGPEVVISVVTRGVHHFALRAEFDAVQLVRDPKRAEPRLRPTCRGVCALGEQIGVISVRGGRDRPVYAVAKISS